MRNRTPAAAGPRPPLPAFEPVPRKPRHDGWTPERQRAFIAALADTGSVSRACAQVNMTTVGAYYLRRQAGADGFRAAWEAALDFGVARMKDIAFERAIEGYLVPVFAGGKLLGWRRKHNDRRLMFCLRHYGEDENGKRTTINYFSTRATAGAASVPLPSEGEGDSREARAGRGGALSQAEALTTTLRTVTTGGHARADLSEDAALIEAFAAVPLDEPARAAIRAILADCAARRRAVEGTADDPAEPFFAVEQEPREVLVYDEGYTHPRKQLRRPPPAGDVVVEPDAFLEGSPRLLVQPGDQHRSGPEEMDWTMLDDEAGMTAIEDAVASVKAARKAARPEPVEGRDLPKLAGPSGKRRKPPPSSRT